MSLKDIGVLYKSSHFFACFFLYLLYTVHLGYHLDPKWTETSSKSLKKPQRLTIINVKTVYYLCKVTCLMTLVNIIIMVV